MTVVSNKSNIKGHLSLLDELLLSLSHLGLGELVDGEAIDYLPLTVLADCWEGVNEVSADAIGVAVRDDSHRGEFAGLGSHKPVVHVVASSVGSGSGRALLHHCDDLSSTLGNLGNESLVKILVILHGFSDGVNLASLED